ncbi:MAG: Cys-tRNA(Pro)/Cys-tRNA(Cys) deacylase [Acidimicrobiia bacterium]|nr:MAG: Cys-tRNA(Pro)/Cys-tRNA(Cys) deacylase [Acidimicrobiia bacterium]
MARGTPATVAARRAGVAHTLHEYAHDRATREYGAEAVRRLGVDPARVAKTLLALTGDGRHVVAVVPVPATLDLKALAAAVGAKQAALAPPADAQRLTGYVVGGISPLGQRRALPTVVDASLAGFATVFVSAGRRGLEIELAPCDLVRLTNATLAPIAKG